MFHYSKEDEAYLAERNGIEFLCEEPVPEYTEEAGRLAECYAERLPELAAFMLEELNGVYGPLTVEEFIARLGRPQIDLDANVVRFLEHDFDDHILGVEFEGELEEFLDFSMDG